MDQKTKTLIIAPRALKRAELPSDWQEQIENIEGISLSGRFGDRMQVHATNAALQAAREKFGDSLLIEEASPRSIPE